MIENNEITVKANVSVAELEEELIKKGFEFCNKYKHIDIFLIPKSVNLNNSARNILKEAIILREGIGISSNRNSKKITFKIKDIDNLGNIISQSAVKCKIESIEDAKKLFEAIEYKELMKLEEIHSTYEYDKFKVILKEMKNKQTLVEIETNTYYKTINELKGKLIELELPIDKSNYFVKKAEEELEKLKARGEV